MTKIDINCDLGEGLNTDQAIMPYISSANIACGYHAGDEQSIKQTIQLSIENRVLVGAHPSYKDKENFGRIDMDLSFEEIKLLVKEQVLILQKHTDSFGVRLNHVKPHGALYNKASQNITIARAIAEAIWEVDRNLLYIGLANSVMKDAACEYGLKFWAEAFVDRAYSSDGFLVSRLSKAAIIENPETCKKCALQIAQQKTISSIEGKVINIHADTICIHGDNPKAIEIAKGIYEYLLQNNIIIK